MGLTTTEKDDTPLTHQVCMGKRLADTCRMQARSDSKKPDSLKGCLAVLRAVFVLQHRKDIFGKHFGKPISFGLFDLGKPAQL
jgi:hypothetical protein